MYRPGKAACPIGHRGFESLPFRQAEQPKKSPQINVRGFFFAWRPKNPVVSTSFMVGQCRSISVMSLPQFSFVTTFEFHKSFTVKLGKVSYLVQNELQNLGGKGARLENEKIMNLHEIRRLSDGEHRIETGLYLRVQNGGECVNTSSENGSVDG